MFEKYTIDDDSGRTIEDQSIQEVFITFKGMTGKSRCMVLFADDHLGVHDEENEEGDKKFLEHWLTFGKSLPPSSYNWPNYEYSRMNRCIRTLCFWILAFIIILFGFVLILYC